MAYPLLEQQREHAKLKMGEWLQWLKAPFAVEELRTMTMNAARTVYPTWKGSASIFGKDK
jgi:hypothetical protein